jgi:drug/metabolite transporter (DMT)-like permease
MPRVKHGHFFQLVGLSALWGASFLFIRVAAPALGPGVLAGTRVLLACLTLGLMLRWLRQSPPWAHWRRLAALGGMAIALPFLLYAWAALTLPGSYMALLNTTAVLFGALSAAWLGDDRLTLSKLIGCGLGLVGVGLIVQLGPIRPSTQVLQATGASLLAAACYGLCTPWMKRTTQHLEPLPIALGMNLAAGAALWPMALWQAPSAQFSAGVLAAVAVLGVGSSGVATWLHLRVMRHVSPVAAMSPAFMIPLFGVAWGHLVLDEPLGTGLLLGGCLILLATALVTGFNPLRRPLAPGGEWPKP